MIDIRLPQISGVTEKEQLQQVKSYLFQLASQLQWALQNVDSVNISASTTPQSQITNPYGVSTIGSQGDGNAYATFNSIKALIIKSAEIVDAYYQEINTRLESEYAASSDFGTFQQQMVQEIATNSEGIEQNFVNLQKISQEIANELVQFDTALNEAKGNLDADITSIKKVIDSVTDSLIDVNACIKSGLLYTDDNGVPVYGLEIGQTSTIDGEEVFNKFARFTAGRLSFYDQNGYEVAYISDYKIYITHAEVTGSLKIGGYLIDTSKGLTFKWVGRS